MRTIYIILITALFTQAQAFNLPKHPTKSYECDVCEQLSHENLQDKWGINNQTLNEKVSNLQKSYSFRERVTAEQLYKGINLYNLAPGAVIRITPMQDTTLPEMFIKTPSNKLLSLKDASSLYSEDEAFGNDLPSTKHQTMIQIKKELGSGTFLIKSKQKNPASETYVISVFDKFSKTYLQVETDSVHYQYGDKLTATISLAHDNDYYDIDDIDARLIGPLGQIIDLKLTETQNNQFQATATLLSEINDHGENWYIEVDIISDTPSLTKRNAHTAFSYSVPSASLVSIKKLSSKPLTFVATLDVATASRYALQSVLYRKSGSGAPKPVETSQKAQWLGTGKQVIQFTFDNSNQLTDDNLFIGYLRLTDYGQLKTVYQYNQPIKLTQLAD